MAWHRLVAAWVALALVVCLRLASAAEPARPPLAGLEGRIADRRAFPPPSTDIRVIGRAPGSLPEPDASGSSLAPAPRPLAPASLALPDLEAIALASNPTLVQAAMRVRAARYRALQAGLYPNPQFGYQSEEIGEDGRAGQQGARLGQEIVTAGKLGYRSAVAAREADQAEAALRAQRQRVLNDVRLRWFDVLVAQRTVVLNQRLVEIGQQGVKAAEELLAAKEVSRVDLLQARIEADTARLQLTNAQNRHVALWRQMTAMLGRPDMPLAPLSGEVDDGLPELGWDELLGRLYA